MKFTLIGRQADLERETSNGRTAVEPHLPLYGAGRRNDRSSRVKPCGARRIPPCAAPSIIVKTREANACVSAGNTGALMAMAHFVLKMLPGVERPAIGSLIPSRGGHTYMLDLGANASATPQQLLQFGVMGSILASDLAGAHDRPRVGLLNIGEEEIKGHETVQAAHNLLTASGLNYVGFVEGHDIFSDKVDVVVTDGFTGNVALKTMEGAAKLISDTLRAEFTRNLARKLRALAAKPALDALRTRLDPRRYNGATMVGLNGIVIKSHGGADLFGFQRAIEVAIQEARNGVPAKIIELLGAPHGA